MKNDKSLLISQLESISDVKPYLQDGAVLVTASMQLAVDWMRRLAAGSTVCETPSVRSWQQWLQVIADRQTSIPVAFTALQEQELWQQVIRASVRGLSPASVRGLAGHAARAYAMMREYRMSAEDFSAGGEESEAFLDWMRQFEVLCREHGRICAADIGHRLLTCMSDEADRHHILLAGFNELTPLQQLLLQQCMESGGRILVVSDKADAPAVVSLDRLADVESECRHAALRVKELLHEDAKQRIAIVTASLPADASMLRRIVDETLLPPSPALPATEQAVAMSGEPLIAMPLIRQLLHLLSLAGQKGAGFEDLSRLLFSPALKGFETERHARAELDVSLRENNRHYISFSALLASESGSAWPGMVDLLKLLLAWDMAPRSAAAWVRETHRLLRDSGCMQINRGRSVVEVRQLNDFRDVLASLVAVDAVSKHMDWATFLLLLRERLSAVCFVLPPRFPQVTVLPLTAIAGMRFDAVVAVGFDEDALPLPVTSQPLLPPAVQRKYRLPESTPELAYAASDFLWQQLKQSTGRLFVSYARQREERELAASPFLKGVAEQQPELPVASCQQTKVEPFDDAPAVALAAAEQPRGGSAIIKHQSACPFRAFATHRLDIVPLGETSPGIDAATKGSLVHLALEHIWKQLDSRESLLQLDEAATAALIDGAVIYAMAECRAVMAEAAREYEPARLQRLLGEWLEIERKRPPFRVARCEQGFELQLPESADLRFPVRLKVDRLDRDEEGRTILIDYKSGQKQSTGKWLGERPAEPQLPLYAVAANLGAGDTVCFARVRSGDMGFEGLSGENTGIKGITVYKGNDEAAGDWPALLGSWRQRVNALAGEFVQGRSDVSPRDAHACDYCGLEAVCRIDETGFDSEAGEEEA